MGIDTRAIDRELKSARLERATMFSLSLTREEELLEYSSDAVRKNDSIFL